MVNRRDRINRTRLPKNPNPQHFSVKEQEKLERLFHRNATLSPSQIEKYYTCGFQYFCRYGLDLKARQKAELSPMHRGNVIHYLLDILLKEYDIIHLSEADLEKLVDRYLLEYLNQVMGGAQEKPQKFLYFYRRLGKTLKRIFSSLKEEFSQTAFQVVGLEEPIRADSSICPLHISVDESHAITVIGKVDRVDLYSFEEENFVRIVDYKSGSKEFDLNGMAAGLHLQMLLYLFAIWRTQNEKYKNVTPAGILYMPAGNPKPILDREASEDAEQDAVQKSFSMNGLLLNSQTVLCAMEKNLEGKFIPVSRGKSGLKGKYLASRAEFAALEKYTMELVQQMGESLFSGNVRPDPIQATVNPPCN
ncbi:MAG: PD-(D/E)XK nuclease family protein, partial [Oscillospiraceae bacterium]